MGVEAFSPRDRLDKVRCLYLECYIVLPRFWSYNTVGVLEIARHGRQLRKGISY